MKCNKKFTAIDLFAGIGGFRIAVENNGGECAYFSEINSDAISAYIENFADSESSNLGDITKLKELPEHDLLTGGVPCQSWSIAGRNLGFDDDRGQLWNDALFLLKQSKPKAFIFENVKGLVDPRNKVALNYILKRIEDAGYFADVYVLNSFDYGVPQSRVRIYIIGFSKKEHFDRFVVPKPIEERIKLAYPCIMIDKVQKNIDQSVDLFGDPLITQRASSTSLSKNNNGYNDYFLFNDLRNGGTTIHSWDILPTTEKQKYICMLLLKNRRKSIYGNLDGNPLSAKHFRDLDAEITEDDLDDLVQCKILKKEKYQYKIIDAEKSHLDANEDLILSLAGDGLLSIDEITNNRLVKINKLKPRKILDELEARGIIKCSEIRYDFKNGKISTGLFGVNRIFLPSSDIFPTLVASDTNDFVTTQNINATNEIVYRNDFLSLVYEPTNYRKISKTEACRIQGFENFILPENRARWMKLIGNMFSSSY